MGLTDKLPLLNSKSKIVKIVGYFLYAFVILIVIAVMVPSEDNRASSIDDTKDTNSTSSDESGATGVKESDVLTVEEVKDMLPSGIDDPAEVAVDGTSVDIVLPFRDNAFGMEYILMGTRENAVEIFKELFKDGRVSGVSVSSQVPLVDKYGNKETGIGTTYMMTSETAAKINWDNFDSNNLEAVSDYSFIHPAMLS